METEAINKSLTEREETQTDVAQIVSINRVSFADKLRAYMKRPFSFALLILVLIAAAITVGAVAYVVLYALVQGIPHLKPSLFAWEWTTLNQSMLPALINTLLLAFFALLIAVPIGVFAAIFMVEYAKSTNVFVKIVRMAAETLAGIPSIVYGLFGMIFFVKLFGWGYCLLSGICTMAIMILPLIMRTTEEALKAVPDSFREGSFALGAGKLRTIFVIILPSAMPGIISGVILGLGRVVGETAALLYTAGSTCRVLGLMGDSRTLAVHMYLLANEGMHVGEAWATGVVLILLVVLINGLAEFVGNKLKKEYN